MAVTMRIAVFLDLTSCSLAYQYHRLRGTLNFSQMLVHFYHTTWCHIPENIHFLQTHLTWTEMVFLNNSQCV